MADDVRHARFDATAMLDLMAANDLRLHDQPGVSERLHNGIYAEVNGGQRMRQLSGDRRLARAWQTTQDDQHAFTAGLRRARA